MEIKTVFGQNGITSIDTYFEYVKIVNNGCYQQLEVKVAGPNFYHNEMALELDEGLLEAFQPLQVGDHEKVERLEDLGGHSIIAFYQEARLIGFQRR